MQRRNSTSASRLAGALTIASLITLWGCTDAAEDGSGAQADATTATGDRVSTGERTPTAAAPRTGGDADATSAQSSGDPAPPLLSTLPVDRATPLLDYYRDVLGAEGALAECYAAAGSAEGLSSVADLEAAEADAELSARLVITFDACEAGG